MYKSISRGGNLSFAECFKLGHVGRRTSANIHFRGYEGRRWNVFINWVNSEGNFLHCILSKSIEVKGAENIWKP